LYAAIYGTAAAGTALPAAAAAPAPEYHVQDNGMTPGIACGIDIEMVESLPVVGDYWRDAFYSATFTPAEIAYCLLQDRPLVHLAARWCAKKALQKCDPAYIQADLRLLEVRLSASGTPYLCAVVDGHSTRLPFAVSLAHTTQTAVAVVVRIPTVPDAGSTVTPARLPAVAVPPVASAETAACWHSTKAWPHQ
jgi:phosphopantetheinyl transferase (holo-ACP synthase)